MTWGDLAYYGGFLVGGWVVVSLAVGCLWAWVYPKVKHEDPLVHL